MKLLTLSLILQNFSKSSQQSSTNVDNLSDLQLFSDTDDSDQNLDYTQQARTFGQIRKQMTSRLADMFIEIAEKKGLPPKVATRSHIMKYGCYCFTSDRSSAIGPRFDYHGPPKDDLDAICYRLYKAQNCLKKDQS